MSKQCNCTTVYVSPELHQASLNDLREDSDSPKTSLSCILNNSLEIHHSIGSTHQLHNTPSSHTAQNTGSLDSLDGSLILDSDSSTEGLPLTVRERHTQTEDEEKPYVNKKQWKKKCTFNSSGRAKASEMQEFQCLPPRLVPAEITHCLFELEKECRGIERESKSVKWKMEMIHRSVQTMQGTLRMLLTHLVEDQSSNRHSNTSSQRHSPCIYSTKSPPALSTSAPLQQACHSQHLVYNCATHPQVPPYTHSNPQAHPKCMAAHIVERRPSVMSLNQHTHGQQMGPCFSNTHIEAPSCAQHRTERIAVLHVMNELRESMEQLHMAQEQQHKEHKEDQVVLRQCQNQIGLLCQHVRRIADSPREHQQCQDERTSHSNCAASEKEESSRTTDRS